MDQGIATALAAGAAAVISLITLLVTVLSDRQSKAEASHREVLIPYLEELSDDIHTILASIHVMEKRAARSQDVAEWQKKPRPLDNASMLHEGGPGTFFLASTVLFGNCDSRPIIWRR